VVSKAERAASAASRTAGRGVGAGIGTALSSPFGLGLLAVGAIGLGLFIFKDRISEFFAGLKFPEIPAIELPTINLPTINFPEFPAFPELPDFSGLFEGFQQQQTNFLQGITDLFKGGAIPQPQKMVEDTGLLSQEDVLKCQCGSSIVQDAFGNVNEVCKQCAVTDTALPSLDPALNIPQLEVPPFAGSLEFLIGSGQIGGSPPPQPLLEQEAEIIIPAVDISGLGGGLSFIGGTTTLGSNIVDTLSEVLQAFPDLTASQAANLLSSNQGLTQTEFSMISPFNPSISSAGGDPEQIINQASGGFSGLTPEQIAFILTGGNIQNF